MSEQPDDQIDRLIFELKGIKNVLSAIWSSRYSNDETDNFNPDGYADEYISVEECAKRLNVAEQTVRNWIASNKKNPTKGWIEGVHYINVSPDKSRKGVVRIPWNHLIRSFGRNKKVVDSDLHKNFMYKPVHNRLNNGSPF